MKNADDTYITIGKIGSTYGIQGWLKIHAFTEFSASILTYQPWVIKKNHGWEILQVEDSQQQGKTVLIKLKDINSPEAARLLTGKDIAIKRSQLPALKKDEYYWSDLIGLTVINKNGENLGKVTSLMATGSNDVLVVKGETEQAIPFFLGEVILNIDLLKQEIHVDWESL